MIKKFTVSCKDESIAYADAATHFSKECQRKVLESEIELVEVSEKAGLFGLGKKKEFTFQLVCEEEKVEKSEVETEISAAFENTIDHLKTPDLDGYFQLRVIPNGVYLRVVGPKSDGNPVPFENILKNIELKELVEVDMEMVEKTWNEATGDFTKIAQRKSELDRDADIQVTISANKMNAYCTYLPALGGRTLNFVEALRLLNARGVQFGIDEKKLDWLLRENIKQDVLIATGKEPEHGKSAELRYHFQMPGEQKHVKELEDGTVDYLNLELVSNVHRGDLLATKISATPGMYGRAVTGEEIKPIAGKDLRLPKGKNTEIGADEMSLFAGIDGQVCVEDGKVSVLPILTIDGDVDLETGNIQFIGNVIIKGNVQEGFTVKADGDIEISGNVGGSTIEAGGRVVVRKGFQGKQKGIIKANGDVQVGFIENGQVVTRGDLYVKGAIMHSEIVAKGDIMVEGRGLIVGGMVQAGNDVLAKTIGSHLATPTEVLAGVDPEIRQHLDQVNVEIESANENMDKVAKGLEQLHKLERQVGKLTGEKQDMITQFENTKLHLEEQLEHLMEQRELLSKQLKEQKNGRIKVSDRVYPGVKIFIGQAGYRVKDPLARTAFVYDEGEVKTRPL